MRTNYTRQLGLNVELNSLGLPIRDDKKSRKLKEMSKIIDETQGVIELVMADITTSDRAKKGRTGLSGDTILRCLMIKHIFNDSYEELESDLKNHIGAIEFVRLPDCYAPSKQTLQKNIAAVKPETFAKILLLLNGHAKAEGMEDGSVLRIDSTVTETLIHDPTDNSLLADCIRVMDQLLTKVAAFPGSKIVWSAANKVTKRANRLCRKIKYCRGEDARVEFYRQLVGLTHDVVRRIQYPLKAVPLTSVEMIGWKAEVEHFLPLIARAIDQCERRVFNNEKVPASEKIVSIFEPHTDIIIKGGRGTEFGHKINLTTGRSGLILDISIESGNPADSEKLLPMLGRHINHYGSTPRQVAADGGYASQRNLTEAKALGVEDMAFHKKCGLKVEEMTKTKRVYRKLRNFRAGIEANISCLKRAWGWGRCNWRGLQHFQAYIWSSAIAYNLSVMAELALA
ncbi:MAG: ISNCY family transposase [Phycisphaerales bacterium]|nr:ISNCY family transposase [Phycisphaerales bacterium]